MKPHVVEIASAGGETRASFVPEVGMLCCSLMHSGRELLHGRRGLSAYVTQGKTMGVPLLYPWANRLEAFHYAVAGREVQLPRDLSLVPQDEHGLPIHGVLPALMGWEAMAEGSELTARFAWTDPRLLRLFPFPHSVSIRAVIGEAELEYTIEVQAGESGPVPVSFGLHPYLCLPATRPECQVEVPVCERLLTDSRGIPTGEREPLGPRSFLLGGSSWDDGLVLGESPTACFSVSGAGRTLVLELLEGFPYGQIFSPPEADFICFEPMTAPANALRSGEGLQVLQAGQSHRARFRIGFSKAVAPMASPT